LREDLLLLISLQRIDTEFARTGLRKRELPNKISRLDETFSTSAEEMEGEKQRLEELIKTHRAKEEGLKKGMDHLKKTKERLLEVKTNKEYQAMLKEIEVIVKKNGEIEDEIILKLEEIDSARSGLKVKELEFETFHSRYEKEKKELESEIGLMDSEISRLIREQAGLRERIHAEILKKYDRIKNHSNGRAVVPVWKGICEACHMNIPPQMYNELQRSDDIMQCPFCSRIIYWDDRGKNV
jgi:predicted  nucleic acid-binding Zn-ribbon protein